MLPVDYLGNECVLASAAAPTVPARSMPPADTPAALK
jgi:hypothetical protein